MLRAEATDTVTTRVFDVALGYPWPSAFPERVLRNEFSARWSGREDELACDEHERHALESAIDHGDDQIAHVDAGQGVGQVSEIRSAAQVMGGLTSGATRLLLAWGKQDRTGRR
jgi:nitronate monooxygenase